jgi:hypothetical protein
LAIARREPDIETCVSSRVISYCCIVNRTCPTSGVKKKFEHAFEQRGLGELLP